MRFWCLSFVFTVFLYHSSTCLPLGSDAECPNCPENVPLVNRGSLPVTKLGQKHYYLGMFFKLNWYRAAQFCRYHGMDLVSITSAQENTDLFQHIENYGLSKEKFWTSGTDLGKQGSFFWLGNGQPLIYKSWLTGQPNNYNKNAGNEVDHCIELWPEGPLWNDAACSHEKLFVCEIQ